MMISQPEQGLENPLDAIAATLHGRRSFLQLGGAGIAAAAIRPNRNGAGSGQSGKQRSTERLVRRLFDAVESGSTSAIWDFFAPDGAIEFPFVGSRYTDFASFDAAIGPLLAALPGLTFTDPDFQFLDDPEALIAKYKGHAIVTFTGLANSLSIDYWVISGHTGTYSVFGSGHSLLDTFVVTASGADSLGAHSFSGNNIATLEFSSDAGYIQVSTLRFNGGSSVPEPSTWLLLSGGLIGLGAFRRFRQA